MKRKPVIIAILTVIGISSYFLWASSAVREGYDPNTDFANWSPTAAEISKQMPAGAELERQLAFAQLFQQRFRKHEPSRAIGVHIMGNGKIHLLTQARLEPWNIDRIALMLYRELQQNFHKNYDIEIYETFIGTRPIKIGEILPSPTDPQRLVVRYHYPRTDTDEPKTAEIPSHALGPRPVGLSDTPLKAPGQQPSL